MVRTREDMLMAEDCEEEEEEGDQGGEEDAWCPLERLEEHNLEWVIQVTSEWMACDVIKKERMACDVIKNHFSESYFSWIWQVCMWLDKFVKGATIRDTILMLEFL